jgi:multiple sugar transport system ATP-binding protein
MNVYRNLAFGMRVRREPRETIKQRVEEVARLLGIEALLDRRPSELSGGQRQRVALGRALLREPQAFLMDEPLSNLDAALRVQMRLELKRLHDRLGVTTVYVTHDQVEAMTMGDRIAIMDGGRLQQIDTPDAIYTRPANLFVAGFIGSPKMNLVPGAATSVGGAPGVRFLGNDVALAGEARDAFARLRERHLTVGVRPEDVRLASDAPAAYTLRLSGTVDVVEPLGSETYVVLRVAGELVTARFPPRTRVAPGDVVEAAITPEHLHLFATEGGENLRVPAAAPAAPAPAPVVVDAPAESPHMAS